ncbi:LysE family translocator [Curvivirga aplysinae]|uniref:LysE family translocator n=1 Tax=Curvivirga aplysinae TaxID=2529852 RepID=UPI0012BC8AA7|nr:LysE family translocator [Curvivirga aplysinae]MTI09704.1 LysE family translocator [Curvivirga aplysinae]
MTIEFALLWLSVLFPLVFSVGPGNLLCAVAGGAQGYRKSLPFILGLDVVYSSYSLIFGFGLGAIVLQSPTLMKTVQVIGAIYVAWLALKFMRRRHVEAKELPQLRFLDGVISQALNVKGISIILTMYSQFLDAEKALVPQVLLLTLALLLLNLFTHSVWTLGGSWMAKTFASDRVVRIQSMIFGIMLLIVAGWLLLK